MKAKVKVTRPSSDDARGRRGQNGRPAITRRSADDPMPLDEAIKEADEFLADLEAVVRATQKSTEEAKQREADAYQVRQLYYQCERGQTRARADLEALQTRLVNLQAGIGTDPVGLTVEDIRERIDAIKRDMQELEYRMVALNTRHQGLTGTSIDGKQRTVSAG